MYDFAQVTKTMNGQTSQVSDEEKGAHPPYPGVSAQSTLQTDLAPRILEVSGVLQTTLEINELFALFASELARNLHFDGLYYDFPMAKIDIRLGQEEIHSCSYELTVATEKLGTVHFFRNSPFNDQELTTAENLLSALLYPLRNTLLYQQALQTAIMDPVTGVKNRTAMDSAVKREIELAGRQGAPLSFILFDIDHFKRVNDQFGHLYGDQALHAVAACAEHTIRESDMLFRYGGEEFLVLLSGTCLEGAELLAERIRIAIEKLQPQLECDIRMTISLGVVTLREEEDSAAVLARADEALYRAKKAGRNRVVTEETE
jgi:diguanylate cyclase (GGDEF)-like protein